MLKILTGLLFAILVVLALSGEAFSGLLSVSCEPEDRNPYWIVFNIDAVEAAYVEDDGKSKLLFHENSGFTSSNLAQPT